MIDDSKTEQLLSAREIQVLNLVIGGQSNKEIAKQLNLSIETVKTHLKHIMAKLGVAGRTQAAVKALKTEAAGETALDES